MRIILLGPTATGKTSLSLKLAKALKTPIISADSRQCYKFLDIGTAKPAPEQLQQVRHYNISILDPKEDDSAMEFQRRAAKWEEEILQEHKHVLFAGGSTLHLQSLIHPFNEMPAADIQNIARLEERAEQEGLESLYGMLQEIDPDYVEKMNGMNRQRIIRALDVWMQTGKTFSSFHRQGELQPDENTIVFGLTLPRDKLYSRINKRVDRMIKAGLENETRQLLEMGYDGHLQSLNTVGYKEMILYLKGKMNLNEAVAKMKTNTRRYAKRQLTWFRRWNFIHWLSTHNLKDDEIVEEIASKL